MSETQDTLETKAQQTPEAESPVIPLADRSRFHSEAPNPPTQPAIRDWASI